MENLISELVEHTQLILSTLEIESSRFENISAISTTTEPENYSLSGAGGKCSGGAVRTDGPHGGLPSNNVSADRLPDSLQEWWLCGF